jgi:HEAT repeat protein
MIKWLADIVGRAAQDGKAAAEDLKRLNTLKPGLGDAALDYVRDGDGETVLSTLATLAQTANLDICRSYVPASSPAIARRRLFARSDPYPFDLVQRYVEVLTALIGPGIDYAPGTQAVPNKLRVFFGEAFLGVVEALPRGPQKAEPPSGKVLPVETALEMARRLDGSLTDVFDVLYVRNPHHSSISGESYRKAVDLRALVEAHPAELVAAARRFPVNAKEVLIRDLSEWKLGQLPAVTEFLVGLAGDGSRSVRERAVSALAALNPGAAEALAVGMLQKGDADQRTGMVELLGRLHTAAALDALRTHRGNERIARIGAAIDTILALQERSASVADKDDAQGYMAIDGRRIAIPPLEPLSQGAAPVFGESDRATLRAAIEQANQRIREINDERTKRGATYLQPLLAERLVEESIALLSGGTGASKPGFEEARRFLHSGPGSAWAGTALARMPDALALAWAAKFAGSAQSALSRHTLGLSGERLREFLDGPGGDIRHLEAFDIDARASFYHGGWPRQHRLMQAGDFLRIAIQDGHSYDAPAYDLLPAAAVWPYLAQNLDVFDEAFGMKPLGAVKLERAAAISLLNLLPAAPARYVPALLETATGTTKAGRAEARAMLQGRPEVEPRLLALLGDSRQAARAGAAEWLGERGDPAAAAAIWSHLKTEKSELVRAAFLTALKRLGEDLSKTLGPDALIAEAAKGLKGAKFDKLDWLGLDALPQLRFKTGATVPKDVLRWWIFLAYKLKQPGGNALFGLYLDQLVPDDAQTFSTWILDSWINYDTAGPSESDANAYAKAHAPSSYQSVKHWKPDYTEENVFAELKRRFLDQYLNSGSDSKGVLGLAARAPSALAVERVRAYLKGHGPRTSQSSALLELLAGIGDPVTLQVVIAAATRLKQKGVQKFAGELVTKVAEARDWTLDELADRTIPSAGFDDDGVLALPCGEDAKEYEARLNDDLTVALRNPSGKHVSALPSGEDEATKAAKKQLSATKKELKQIAEMQTARLYEALCAERSWPSSDWLNQFHAHPVMRKMIQRLVWLGVDDKGAIAGSFRPTAEGDFTDVADGRVDVNGFAAVRLAHGALLNEAAGKAWQQHLADYEVKPLFAQFGRTLLQVADGDKAMTEIVDRKGWVTDAFTVRGIASKLGYERGPALDGGFFNEYRKGFSSAGIIAVVEFTGNGLPEENVPAAIISLKFEKTKGAGRSSAAVKLADVPPVLLSECWNDYRAFAAKGAYDEDWKKRSPW